jgi:hypothetical protein
MASRQQWTRADAMRDASDLTEELNDDIRQEMTSDRDAYLDEYDLRPDPSEL